MADPYSLLQARVSDSSHDEKIGPLSGRCQRIRLSMTRRPLNRLFRRDVQCRDQSVVDRHVDRSHPNKVSMKKKRKEEEVTGEGEVFIREAMALVLSEICYGQ